ncbi:MAG: response regulator transcription factor [Bacteroidales bacterium]|nr:response regulator transcription factor [Bacteroidales bacterium]
MKLLVVEDNKELLDIIVTTMIKENYKCEKATSYNDADEKIHLYTYDILIIDINLPGGSGLDLIRYIKITEPATGVIVISARNSLKNKIEGLDLGADDYITKPFDVAELVARVKALLRRRKFKGSEKITFNEIVIDTIKRTVSVKNNNIELTKTEFDILLFFFSNQGRVLTKETIAEHIWGDNMDLVDSFDFIYSHIKNIRRKITEKGVKIPIKAVYGLGYKLEEFNGEIN